MDTHWKTQLILKVGVPEDTKPDRQDLIDLLKRYAKEVPSATRIDVHLTDHDGETWFVMRIDNPSFQVDRDVDYYLNNVL